MKKVTFTCLLSDAEAAKLKKARKQGFRINSLRLGLLHPDYFGHASAELRSPVNKPFRFRVEEVKPKDKDLR